VPKFRAWGRLIVVVVLAAAWPAVPGDRGEVSDRPWEVAGHAPERRADDLLAAMTLPEKLTMLHGGAECGYVGCLDGNGRLGIPPLHLQDGPAGVGQGLTGVTQLAAPVSGAASPTGRGQLGLRLCCGTGGLALGAFVPVAGALTLQLVTSPSPAAGRPGPRSPRRRAAVRQATSER
jgi:hypothetical protein